MSCSSAAPLSKHFSVVETSLTSLPKTLFTKTQNPSRKPIKLSLSAAFPLWASLQAHKKFSSLRIIALVAQTSDWAQQGEEENQSWENQEIAGSVDGEERFGGGSEENYIEPPEEAKLFVGNLPYDFDSERLAQLFNQAGVVEISEVIYSRETDQSRGFGFVTMCNVEEAERAVEMFHRYDVNGRLLTVNKAALRGSRPERPQVYESSYRIYVGNLPWQVNDARLEQVFSEHGKVVNARVVCDRETGRSRGFGFVTMSSEAELNDAIAALDGQVNDARLEQVFSEHGKVVNARVVCDRETGRSCGFGFVTMSSEAELNDAIAALDGQNLDGRAIRVNVAEERSRRSSF